MNIKYEGVAVMVADLEASRRFYEGVLGQKVLMDNGPHVAYEGGFSLWEAGHAAEVVFGKAQAHPGPMGEDNFELYFECGDIDAASRDMAEAGVNEVHPVVEQPWGQRVARYRDPDGHLVELAEPLPLVVRRFMGQGMSLEQVAEKTSMPLELVKQMAEVGA